MINQIAKLTTSAAVAALALLLAPLASRANPPAMKTVHQSTDKITQFQSQKSAADWDHDEHGFYHPTLSPSLNECHASGSFSHSSLRDHVAP